MESELSLTVVHRPGTERDLIDEWFSALEKHGECCRIRLGRYVAGTAEPEWFFLPHQRYDGLGALARVQAHEFGQVLDLPRSSEQAPGWLRRWLAAFRCALRRRPELLTWRDENRSWRPVASSRSSPTSAAWIALSEVETSSLRKQARERGVSMNAWLLFCLARTALPRLRPGRGHLEWLVPLNLRGAVDSRRDTSNTAATLDVSFSPDASAEQVHAALSEQIAQRAHFGAWQLVQVLRWFSRSFLEKVARRELLIPKHGCFSNLGALSPRALAANSVKEWWMAFNTVFRSRPVGAACLTWRGRLTLTLQLHPALTEDAERARRWLDEWAEHALGATPRSRARAVSATSGDGESPHLTRSALPTSTAGTTTDLPGAGSASGT
jgi:hypothetical protein